LWDELRDWTRCVACETRLRLVIRDDNPLGNFV
jgi:hypothetical protein